MRSASSASNLQQVESKQTISKTNERQTESVSATDRKKLAKSTSVTNLPKRTENLSMDTAETSQEVKSIMKKSTSASMNSDHNSESEASRPKRGVKILEKIDDKNDQLENLKIDNKTKHSASTSTPTARRRPLKAPQDVSMICKS